MTRLPDLTIAVMSKAEMDNYAMPSVLSSSQQHLPPNLRGIEAPSKLILKRMYCVMVLFKCYTYNNRKSGDIKGELFEN